MRRDLTICVVLGAVTLALFWRLGHAEFLGYDDPAYVTMNSLVQRGLTSEGARWAFTTGQMGSWMPVTWVSHMLDCQLFGAGNAGAHHLTNVLIHIMSTVILYMMLRRATGAVWRSAFVAALFAWHPLHVESVAWVSERKDVLCALFWMLTLWAYVRYAGRPGALRYAMALLFFALALMSKPMIVTLPVVLLLLDYWPLRRVGHASFGDCSRGVSLGRSSRFGYSTGAQTSWRTLLLEKVPFIVLAVALSAMTVWSQRAGGAVAPLNALAVGPRLLNATWAYAVYIGKMIWPSDLIVFYPHYRTLSGGHLEPGQVIGAAFLLVGASACTIAVVRRAPYFAVGWFWYLVTLLPVIGLVQVGIQSRADRYTYIPLIGLFIVIAWGVPDLLERWQHGRAAVAGAGVAAVMACVVVTWIQVGYWHSDETLFGHAVQVMPDNYLAHDSFAGALKRRGQVEQAIVHYREALRLKPNYVGGMNNFAWLLATQEDARYRDPAEAIRLAEKANEYTANKDPWFLDTLAAAYAAAGRFDDAIRTAEQAILVAIAAGLEDLAKDIQGRLELYKTGQPFRNKSTVAPNR